MMASDPPNYITKNMGLYILFNINSFDSFVTSDSTCVELNDG